MQLENKVAVVTGGAQGIGREIALVLAREGADIVIWDVKEDIGRKTEEEIKATGRRALLGIVDVTSSASVEENVGIVLDKFQKIDILVNNAGVTRDGLLLRMKEEEWDLVLKINLKGTFNCTKAVSRVMLKQHQGRIVNIASVVGIMGNAGQANYSASKAGVIGFTKSVAKELASRNILVNAIAPGYIKTEMTGKIPEPVRTEIAKGIPLGKLGEPGDVAGAVLFLVSDNAGYITGQVIQVDGGMLM